MQLSRLELKALYMLSLSHDDTVTVEEVRDEGDLGWLRVTRTIQEYGKHRQVFRVSPSGKVEKMSEERV